METGDPVEPCRLIDGPGEAVTGLDNPNVQIPLKAVLHASGQRQFPVRP